MTAELEALVKALDAVIEARSGEEAKRLEELYDSRLEDVLSRNPGLSREKLALLVDFAYRQWLRAERKPSSIPPKA